MQRHKNLGACTYVLSTLYMFALKMAVFNCDIRLDGNVQAELTAVLSSAVRSNYDRIMSPALIQETLLVAALGAENGTNTQKELERTLKLSGSKDELAKRLEQFSEAVHSENYFFVNRRLLFDQKFRQRTINIPTVFLNFDEVEKVATVINDLVANRTDNQLQKDKSIVKERNIDDDTTMIELSLINFSANWETPVTASTDKSYPNSMYTYGTFLYGRVEKLQATAAVLPFKGTKARMLLIFADESHRLIPLENRLMQVDITKIPSVLKYRRTGLYFPSFRFQTVHSLSTNLLKKMKIKEALTGKASFNEFFSKKAESFIKKFDQFSSIKVDMNGVKFASAASTQYEVSSVIELLRRFIGTQLHKEIEGRNPYFYYIIDGENVLAAGSSYNGN